MHNNGSWKILIAENDEEFREKIASILKNMEYGKHPVSFIKTDSYENTLKEIDKNPDIAVAILNTDLSAEKIIKYIRDSKDNRNLRIIAAGKKNDPVMGKKVLLDYDVCAFIKESEVFDENITAVVHSGLRSYHDIHNILTFKRRLEKKVKHRTEQLEHLNSKFMDSIKKLERDWYAGRKIQIKLMPKEEKEFGSFKFSRRLFASLYLSGDFVDYFYINRENICFYIADVSGHGISSALVTVVLKGYMNNYLDEYKTGSNSIILDPEELLSRVNEDLIREDLEKHLTIFLGIINIKTNKLIFTNGGHFPLPLICSEDTTEFIEAKGKPVGLFDFVKYKKYEMTLPDKFLMFMCSDGIMEIIDKKTIKDKLDYIRNTVNNANMNMDELVRMLGINNIQKLPDDVTFLLLKR